MLEVTKALNIKDKQSNDNMGMFFNCRVVKIFYFKAVKVITLKKKILCTLLLEKCGKLVVE